jgi:hypothetical protein
VAAVLNRPLLFLTKQFYNLALLKSLYNIFLIQGPLAFVSLISQVIKEISLWPFKIKGLRLMAFSPE